MSKGFEILQKILRDAEKPLDLGSFKKKDDNDRKRTRYQQ